MVPDLILDKKYNNVGVKLSGGADSAIVYYGVCEYYRNTDTNIYVLTMDTTLKGWYSRGAAHLIDIVENLTGVSPVDHFIWDEPNHINSSTSNYYSSGINDMENRAVNIYDLDAIYSGLTINPPVDEMRRYFIENSPRWNLDLSTVMSHINGRDTSRDTTEERPFFTKRYSETKTVDRIRPFIDKDKRAVAAAYEYYNVTETLYPHTYSCENVEASKTFTPCCHCFFCLERYYGFGRMV